MLSGDGGSGVDGIETVPPAPEVSDPELSALVDRIESAIAELAGQASVSWTNADRRRPLVTSLQLRSLSPAG